mmetsp:Transcript_1721/g.4711  ORF Transcript_1721/g.4711 Transcript_1721/m.4711 type:complete len:135 (-) Transcript_1721:1058-1462(-)
MQLIYNMDYCSAYTIVKARHHHNFYRPRHHHHHLLLLLHPLYHAKMVFFKVMATPILAVKTPKGMNSKLRRATPYSGLSHPLVLPTIRAYTRVGHMYTNADPITAPDKPAMSLMSFKKMAAVVVSVSITVTSLP